LRDSGAARIRAYSIASTITSAAEFPKWKPNPFGKADWEGTGVESDVKVKAADAVETAEKLAASKLQKK
jgi:hypothetical protein